MRRYVSVKRSAAGKTVATVSLVDDDLSSAYSAITYTGQVAGAVKEADRRAREQLEGARRGLDEVPAFGE